MQSRAAAAMLALGLLVAPHDAAQMRSDNTANPVAKVIQLLTQLQGSCIRESEEAKKTYDEFTNWCSRTSTEKQHEIEDGSAQKEQLEAEIQKAVSLIEEDTSRIQELSGSIATDEADLKAATLLREKEKEDFDAVDQELTDTTDTLSRAIQVLEREVHNHPGQGAAFLQKPTQGMIAFQQAISGLLDAATVISVDDRAVLNGLISRNEAGSGGDGDDGDDGLPSPAAMLQGGAVKQPAQAAYTPVSGGIIETLENMQDKAEASQAEARKKEANAKHSFEILKLSIDAKLDTEKRELDDTKKDMASQTEKKAVAMGDLETVKKDLENDKNYLVTLQHDCMDRAVTFQADMTNRKEELAALASAKKVIQSMTSGASSQTYGFLQTGAVRRVQGQQVMLQMTSQQRAGVVAWQKITTLAKAMRSVALAQLSNRLASAIKITAETGNHADPFGKVKKMLQGMIEKLTKDGQEEESQKAFCDKEMGHTEEQKTVKGKKIEELSTMIEKAAADSARLKEEIAEISNEIADLQKSQADSQQIRQTEHEDFVKASTDIKAGLKGIQMALTILREYYGGGDQAAMVQVQAGSNLASSMGDAASAQAALQQNQPRGGAAGIIGMLEVVESDFSKQLAEVEQEEDANQETFEKLTLENKVTKAIKESDVQHKGREATSLDKTASELTSDRNQVQEELDAVLEYYEKLKPQCITKPDSYDERKARREKEVKGLEEALEILENAGGGSEEPAAEGA